MRRKKTIMVSVLKYIWVGGMKKKLIIICVGSSLAIPAMSMDEDVLGESPTFRLKTKKTPRYWLMSARVSPGCGNDQKPTPVSYASENNQQRKSLFLAEIWDDTCCYFEGLFGKSKKSSLKTHAGEDFQQSEHREVGHVQPPYENVALCSNPDDVNGFLAPTHVARVNSATDSSVSITVDGSIMSDDSDSGKSNYVLSRGVIARLNSMNDKRLLTYQEGTTYTNVVTGCQNKKDEQDDALSQQQIIGGDCKRQRITFYQEGTSIDIRQALTNYIIDELKTIFFPEYFFYSFEQDLKQIWILDDSCLQLKMAARALAKIAPDFTIQQFSHVSKAMAYLKNERKLPYAVITYLHMGEAVLNELIDDTKHEEKRLREGVFLALFLRHVGFKGLITAVTADEFDQTNFIRQTFLRLPNEIPLFDNIRGKILDDTRHTLMLDYSRDEKTGLLCETNILVDVV